MIDRWAGGPFGVFTYLAGASLVAVGAAVIDGGALSAIAGWAAIATGVVIVVGYAVLSDMPPFVSYMPTGLLGIVLLLQLSS
jgi:FtsH-binding integral membrane protein